MAHLNWDREWNFSGFHTFFVSHTFFNSKWLFECMEHTSLHNTLAFKIPLQSGSKQKDLRRAPWFVQQWKALLPLKFLAREDITCVRCQNTFAPCNFQWKMFQQCVCVYLQICPCMWTTRSFYNFNFNIMAKDTKDASFFIMPNSV